MYPLSYTTEVIQKHATFCFLSRSQTSVAKFKKKPDVSNKKKVSILKVI